MSSSRRVWGSILLAGGSVLGVGVSLAGEVRNPSAVVPIDSYLARASRPYAARELYAHVDVTQKVPEIRVARLEMAYASGTSASQICQAYQKALVSRFGSGGAISNSVNCQPYPLAEGESRVRTVFVAHYPRPSRLVTETVAAMFTVCRPAQLYDASRHVCYYPADTTDSGN